MTRRPMLALCAGLLVAVAPVRAEEAYRPPVVRTLSNGLEVAVFSDHRVPVVQMQLMIPAGVAHEPQHALGVAALTAQMLRHGTTSRTAEGFAGDVDDLGGIVTTSAQRDYSIVGGAFLASQLESGFELLADALLNPVFPSDELERLKRQTLGVAHQARGNADALADDHLAAHLFPGHPYARPVLGTIETLPRIGVDQVRAFHRAFYRPRGAVLAIAGDIAPSRALALVEARLGGWSGGEPPAPAPPSTPGDGALTLVDLPSADRAEIRFGWLTPPRSHADAAALALANRALAGSVLDSRMSALATRGAFAGGFRSTIGYHRSAGSFVVVAAVSPDSVEAAVARLRGELKRFAAAPVSEAEIARHARALRNAVPLQHETPGQVIGNWLLARLYGLPEDQAARTAEEIGRLTSAEVGAATARWLDAERAQIVVVGPAKRIRPQLERLGAATVVAADAPTITVPPRAAATTEAPSEAQLAQGRAVVEKSVVAHGGSSKLRGIKDSTLEGEAVLLSGGKELVGTLRQVRKEPYRMLYQTNFFTNETYQVLNGDHGWMRMSGTAAPSQAELDSAEVQALRFAYASDLPHLLLTAADPKSRVAWRGREPIGGRDADVIEVVSVEIQRFVLFIDADNQRVIGIEQNQAGAGQGWVARRLFRDFRPVNGILWPHYEERQQNGQRIMRLTVRKVALNTGVKDSLFELK